MKNLIILLFVIIGMNSCHTKSYKYIIVEKVELNTWHPDNIGKYVVTIKNDYNTPFSCNHEFYTNDIYTAGDTLKLTK